MRKKLLILITAGLFLSCLLVGYLIYPSVWLGVSSYYGMQRANLTLRSTNAAGFTIPYLEGGKGPTIVLLHGFGGDKSNWIALAQSLTPSYHVVIPDLPGFGASSRNPNVRYDAVSQAARVDAFVYALGINAFHIAGNSFGGNIAAVYTASYRPKVLSLALIDTAGVKAPKLSEMELQMKRGKVPLLIRSQADFDNALGLMFYRPPKLPGRVKQLMAEVAIAQEPFSAKIYQDISSRPAPMEPLMKRFRVPVLVIWGEQDRVVDLSSAAVLGQGIPAAQVAIIKNCGHAPMIEKPGETAVQYRGFLTRVKPGK